MSVTNLFRRKGVSISELKTKNNTNNDAQNRRAGMKKLIIGGFLVAAILGTAGFAAMRVSTTEASETTPAAQTATERGITAQQADATEAGETTAKPYIGISIKNASGDGGAAGALVVGVVEGSPADGRLQVDDIITAIDGAAVSGARDVVSIVHEGAPGDSIVFSVSRGGSAMDISITAGELPTDGHPHANRRHGHTGKRAHGYEYGHMGMGKGMLGSVHDSLITSKSRYLTDDGVKTVLTAAGTTQNIDATAGTLDLLLRDESETLSFTVNDDTKIFVQGVDGAASIADLSADTDTATMVMQVTNEDGTQQVHFVAQGNFAKPHIHRHRSNGK
ncbi:MAG: PDZ domain-containing protein [Chloroflexi bacterium]|nr:PDZ domain-containing protein [Chloroflexota bacterium]